MATNQIDTEQLVDAALRMSRPELERFVARIFALKAREQTPSLPQRECELLININQGPPEELQRRYDSLVRKRRHHKLAKTEHRELLALTQQLEQFDAERLTWLAELAALRGVSLSDLMRNLGLEPPEPQYA